MTTYNEDIFTDSYTPGIFTPVVGDMFNGTLNSDGIGTDQTDDIQLNVIAGYSYTITSVNSSFAQLFLTGNGDVIFGQPGIDGPDRELTFTAQNTGTVTLIIGSDFNATYTIDIAAIESPVDPNTPTEGNDTVFGTSGADNVMMLGGDDRFVGGGGKDTIDGGDGRDILLGQGGADSIFGGLGDDKIFGGSGTDTIDGGDGRDNLYGNGGADLINGGNGNDKLTGGGGNDTMNGGNNNDRMFGGAGNDFMEGDIGNDIMQGQNGNDDMHGGAGKDRVVGGNGEDTINGGAGDDILRGGSGADVFVFENGMNRDLITDFEDGLDLLDFSAMGLFDISQLTLTQVGNHLVINASPSDFVTIRNIDVADLTNEDFIFDDILVVG